MKRNWRRTHRVFREAYGNGPWVCSECGEIITVMGRHTMDGNVHHLDEDKTNDAPENLVILHVVCHLRLHPSDAKRISATLKGRPSPTKGMKFSAETNAKKSRPGASNPYFGRTHSEETRTKMRKPRRREVCTRCNKEYAINWIRRHACRM